jgi:hypothetical protein
MKMKTLCYFAVQGTTHLAAQPNIPEVLNFQKHLCDSLDSHSCNLFTYFITVTYIKATLTTDTSIKLTINKYSVIQRPCELICIIISYIVGQDSSVDIATCYGLDGPGLKSRWGQDFPRPFRLTLGTTQPPIQWVLGLSWE